MRASARLAVAYEPSRTSARTRITCLASDPPLVFRPVLLAGPETPRRWNLRGSAPARVALAAAAAGPIGGDVVWLDITVGAGAALVVRSVAATLLLPGPHGVPSCVEVTIRVDADATLVWLPGPVIAAQGCDHHATTAVTLAPGARLLTRDELVLGRYGERPGSIRQRLRVCLGGRPLHDQELHLGPRAPGFEGPAVTGGRRVVGSTLVVDPDWVAEEAFKQPAVAAAITTARLPLCGPAVLITAVAPDLFALRHRLDTTLAELEDHPTRRRGIG